MERWIALFVVIALFRPLVWGALIFSLWAIGRRVLSDRAGRVVFGHYWTRTPRDVWLRAATGSDRAAR